MALDLTPERARTDEALERISEEHAQLIAAVEGTKQLWGMPKLLTARDAKDV